MKLAPSGNPGSDDLEAIAMSEVQVGARTVIEIRLVRLVCEASPSRIPFHPFRKFDEDGVIAVAIVGPCQVEGRFGLHFLTGKYRVVLIFICNLAHIASDLVPRVVEFDDQ